LQSTLDWNRAAFGSAEFAAAEQRVRSMVEEAKKPAASKAGAS
jgi:hypothetical protein